MENAIGQISNFLTRSLSSVPGQSIRTGNHQAFHCSIQACFIQFQVYFLIDIATLNSYFDETKHCGTSEYLGEAKASSFYNNDILEEDLPKVIQLRHLSISKFCVAFAKSLTFSPLLLRAKAGIERRNSPDGMVWLSMKSFYCLICLPFAFSHTLPLLDLKAPLSEQLIKRFNIN